MKGSPSFYNNGGDVRSKFVPVCMLGVKSQALRISPRKEEMELGLPDMMIL